MLKALKEKQEALRKKKKSDIIYYGLWQSCTAVHGILRSITKQTEKRKTLIAQLRFNILSRSALGKLSSQSLVLLKEKVTNASFVNIVALGLWRTIKSSIP
jgi:hypothetical protein